MEPGTTARRKLTPPIVIVDCPGGGGHLWAKINPRWLDRGRGRGRPPQQREVFWCPDHQDEKAEHIRERIQEAHHEKAKAYAELPPPATKRCTNPNPTTHEPGAVFPSGKFYRHTLKRSSGSTMEVLGSRCKDCVKKSNADRRAKEDKEAVREATRKRQAKWSEPFRRWVIQHQKATGLGWAEMARSAKLESSVLLRIVKSAKNVRLSTVDAIGLSCGYPDLVVKLYPMEQESAAA
jgi:hypothetical protein